MPIASPLPNQLDSLWSTLNCDGFAMVRAVYDVDLITRILVDVEQLEAGEGVRRRGRSTYAVRNCLSALPQMNELAEAPTFRQLIQSTLGESAQVTRAILFDKNPDANWAVPWHQDTTIAVSKRTDEAGFGPWSIKSGIHHVQPPANILDQMVTARIHLDPCGEDNGALRILPGTHRQGILDGPAIESAKSQRQAIVCNADAGDVLLMRPLVLHASAPSVHPTHRRILHLEFASIPLPGDLSWCNA